MPKRKNSCAGGHEIHNFRKLFFGHHFYTLRLFDLCHGVEKIFKEMHFHDFSYMTTP